MATNYYLQLDGIRGSSQATRHPEEIDVINYELGNRNFQQSAESGGAAPGKINISEIRVTKKMDIASPRLMNFYQQGRHLAKAKLIAENVAPDGKIKQLLSIEMEDVFISNYVPRGATEELTLNFSKFKYVN